MQTGQCAALDTHVLRGHCSGNGSHSEAIKLLLKEKKFSFTIPPSTMRDLAIAHDEGFQDEVARVIDDIEDSLFEAKLLPDADVRIIESKVDCLEAEGITADRAALRLVVEASYLKCDLLITTRPALIAVGADNLEMALLSCGLHPIIIRESRQIVEYLKKK